MLQLVVWFGGRGGHLCESLSWYPRVINIFSLPVVSIYHVILPCILNMYVPVYDDWYLVPSMMVCTQFEQKLPTGTTTPYCYIMNITVTHIVWLVWFFIYGQIFAIPVFGLSRKQQNIPTQDSTTTRTFCTYKFRFQYFGDCWKSRSGRLFGERLLYICGVSSRLR